MKNITFSIFLLLGCALNTYAQFSLTGQVRTRTEIRNGLGNLLPQDSKAAGFTSQRTRLNFGYKMDRVNFGAVLQDVRVWGQDASTISNADGNKLMLHEGWADITLANSKDSTLRFKAVESLSLKIGRQELNYDDVRLLGNLDWLQQARRFDMALLKTSHKGLQLDIGYAFNQNSDGFNIAGTQYLPGNVPTYVKDNKGMLVPTPNGIVPLAAAGSLLNNSSKNGNPIYLNPPSTNGANQDYKSFFMIYASKKVKNTKISALLFNDNFGKSRLDSVATTNGAYVYGKRYDVIGSNSRVTLGAMLNQTIGKDVKVGQLAIQAAYYSQTGKDRDGLDLSASHFMTNAIYAKNKWSGGLGYEFLSGNDANTVVGQNNRFDPLYGTPHRHWGYLDYFYVGTGSTTGGLSNLYAKSKYTTKDFFMTFDIHSFATASTVKKSDGSDLSKGLGTEIDFVANYTMNRITTIEFGYSIMRATDSMSIAKGQNQALKYDNNASWAYLMINIRPVFFYKAPEAKKK
jgi:hypothetical protein